ncbi:MAG: hypothetical protein HUJ96_08610 [Marinilabiliaceae bacterium]|nr:hypothetical protein [Marinilabiliaceae bacterium]
MKKLLLSVAALFATLCATAQEQVYVILDDGSALSYPIDKVSTLTFDASEASTVKGYSDILKEIDDLKEQCDTLKKYYYLEKGQLVDLGLESGTLWATYNVGATKPEEYGSYFAWGETEVKDTYPLDDSKWGGVPYTALQQDGIIDNNRNLTAEYDAATVNWGEDWRMPTFDEIEELVELEAESTAVNGVQGLLFHGKGDKSDNILFIPFVGRRYGSELEHDGQYGYYWPATADWDDMKAYFLYVNKIRGGSNINDRGYGHSVRAVLRSK